MRSADTASLGVNITLRTEGNIHSARSEHHTPDGGEPALRSECISPSVRESVLPSGEGIHFIRAEEQSSFGRDRHSITGVIDTPSRA